MSSLSFEIAGAVGLRVEITEQTDGSLRFDLRNQGDQVGDLRGLFFDFADSDQISRLSVSGSAISGQSFGDERVTNLGGGVNMNGVSAFDVGVAFGTAGIGKDDIRDTFFFLRSSSGALDLSDVAGMDFGARFTSVGDAGGSRDDSLKLMGEAPDYTPPSTGGGTPLPPFEVIL